MKRYIGTKVVTARPMTRGAYNDYRGWTIPANEDPDEAGYLVEYPDGGPPNHALHANYISWTPAGVFNAAYHELPGVHPDHQPHQQRVVDEQSELDIKIVALQNFIGTNVRFLTLDPREQNRMEHQLATMCAYSGILGQRIAAF